MAYRIAIVDDSKTDAEFVLFIPVGQQLILPSDHILCGDLIDLPSIAALHLM